MNTACGGLLALLACLFVGGSALAEVVTFRNDLRGSVVVQTMTVIRGATRRDQPELLGPGETSTRMPLDGDKIVTVYDGRSNKVLYRDALKASRIPLDFSISLHPRLGKVVVVPTRRAAMPGKP